MARLPGSILLFKSIFMKYIHIVFLGSLLISLSLCAELLLELSKRKYPTFSDYVDTTLMILGILLPKYFWLMILVSFAFGLVVTILNFKRIQKYARNTDLAKYTRSKVREYEDKGTKVMS